ncbi:MAG TPA: tetratricopeptide repeat protein [Candidatus Dormibacteraeota bacterium]|nr:tetratricopeptide repeat protein [Candidatus Dormibacteraeota bacterium]
MTDHPSMQDIFQRRQQTGFIGRQDLLARFQENLALPVDDPRHRFLFNVFGDPGVGKSFLLHRLHVIALDRGARSAIVDDRVFDVPGTMAAIAEQLAAQHARMRNFDRRFQRYEERRLALLADTPWQSGAPLLLARLAIRLGLRAARPVPLVGFAAEAVEPEVVEQVDHLHGLLTRVLRSRGDARLVLTPTEELTPLFVQDLNQIASRRPVTLFFDVYERTSPLLDPWLIDLIEHRMYGDLPANLTITLASQERLDPVRWAGLLTEIEPIELGRFSEAEARQLLASKDVRDEAVVEAIFSLTGRLPLEVAMLAERSPVDPAALVQPGSDAVEQFLRLETNERRREVAMLAALPRLVDEDAVAELTGPEDAPELYEWLRHRSFVVAHDGACSYHDLVRAPLLRLQRERAPQRWRRNHRRLAELNRDCRLELDLSDAEGWADPVWQRYMLEETYHRLCGTPHAALQPALTGTLHAYARAGRPLARRWAEMLRQAGDDGGAFETARWGRELTARAGEDEDCWSAFVTLLLDRAELPPADRALALGQRAECHALDRDFEEALEDFARALELDPDSASLYAARGQTLRVLGRLEDALRDFDHAIELAPDSETALASRGVILQRLGRLDEAVADLSRAIVLRPSDDWALAHRGEAYRMMGRYRLAVADFTEAIRLEPSYEFAYASRALARRRLGHHREELADLDRAIELNPDYEWAYAQRGVTHRAAGRHDRAVADFTRAIELDPDYAWAYANRGVAHRQAGHYPEALADLTRALELDPTSAWALTNRGVTLRQTGRYREALADLEQATTRLPQDAWAIGNRAETLRLLGRDEEALADFDRALALRPSAWALARRAAARRRGGDLEGASSDVDRALQLDLTEGEARFVRARLLLAAGHREEAAEDMAVAAETARRSMEERPDDPVGLLRMAVVEAARERAGAVALGRQALLRGAAGPLVDAAVRELRELAGWADQDSRVHRLLDVLVPATSDGEGD